MSETETPARILSYFSTDGNYGDGGGLLILETTSWSELDWQMIEEVSDEDRPTVARLIVESYEPDADQAFIRKKLEDDFGFDFSEHE